MAFAILRQLAAVTGQRYDQLTPNPNMLLTLQCRDVALHDLEIDTPYMTLPHRVRSESSLHDGLVRVLIHGLCALDTNHLLIWLDYVALIRIPKLETQHKILSATAKKEKMAAFTYIYSG